MGEETNACSVWVGKSEDDTPLGIRRSDRRILLKWEIVDCVHLAQDTDQRRAIVIALVKGTAWLPE
jgi:hypothetical protein